MPWTHSLFMAILWGWLAYRITKAPALWACVFSHWVLDFIAHGPDLQLLPRGGPKVGLGLWRFREASFIIECALVLGGWLIYMSATRAKSAAGRYASGLLVAFLIAAEAYNLYGPAPGSIQEVAISAELAYVALATLATWVDRFRISKATADAHF